MIRSGQRLPLEEQTGRHMIELSEVAKKKALNADLCSSQQLFKKVIRIIRECI